MDLHFPNSVPSRGGEGGEEESSRRQETRVSGLAQRPTKGDTLAAMAHFTALYTHSDRSPCITKELSSVPWSLALLHLVEEERKICCLQELLSSSLSLYFLLSLWRSSGLWLLGLGVMRTEIQNPEYCA